MRPSFRKEQLQKWEELLTEIFPDGIPERFEWTSTPAIIEILDKIGHADASNHTFFPDSGGLDLTGAKQSNEQGCVEVNFDSLAHVLKITKVKFQPEFRKCIRSMQDAKAMAT